MNNKASLFLRKGFCKLFFILFLLVGLSVISYGQALKQCDWLTSFGGSESDVGRSVCTDQKGNIYVTGYFQGEATFGDVILISQGDTDIFLAKLDPMGNLIWVSQFGSGIRRNLIATEMGTSLKSDNLGHVYLAGIFSYSTIFGDTTLTSNGGDDIFIAKFNENGRVIWAYNYGTIGHDFVYDIELDKDGSLILSGSFGINPTEKSFRMDQQSSYAILARINQTGEMSMIRYATCTGNIRASSTVVDVNNNIFWGLDFTKEIAFGEQQISSRGKSDMLIEKLSPLGTLVWQKHIGGRFDDKINDLMLYKGCELLLTGSFEDKITIGDRELLSNGQADLILCQIDESGNVPWVETIGGKMNDKGISVSSIDDEHIVVAGIFQDKIVVSLDTIESAGYYDVVIACFDKNHSLSWVSQLGNKNGDFIESISLDERRAYFAGHFRGEMTVNLSDIVSKGRDDIFVGCLPLLSDENVLGTDDSPIDPGKLNVEIDPNPSSGIFYLTSNYQENITVDVTILNTAGYNVMTISNKEIPSELNLLSMPNGVYFVHINFQGIRIIKKIIISPGKD